MTAPRSRTILVTGFSPFPGAPVNPTERLMRRLPLRLGAHQSGVTFIPVGSVSTSGYFSVDSWFRKELKQLGTPILSGSLKTLIRELKSALP